MESKQKKCVKGAVSAPESLVVSHSVLVKKDEKRRKKPTGEGDALNALRSHYKISVDWGGKNYCRLTINWHDQKNYVDVSMPGYIPAVFARLQHKPPLRPQLAPHQWTQPAYGQKLQLAPIDDSPKLDKIDIKFVQSCVGSLLYYAHAVDAMMLPAINEISGSQASPTTNTMKACTTLMDYAHTYPLAILHYHASDMALHIDSDAAYLVLPNARSHYAGHLLEQSTSTASGTPDTQHPTWCCTYHLQNHQRCLEFSCRSYNWRCL
jgi:hypothetical protein